MDDKKLENVKPAKNHNSTNFICGGKAIKATSDYELDKKPRMLPQFATQLVVETSVPWLGNISLTFLR